MNHVFSSISHLMFSLQTFYIFSCSNKKKKLEEKSVKSYYKFSQKRKKISLHDSLFYKYNFLSRINMLLHSVIFHFCLIFPKYLPHTKFSSTSQNYSIQILIFSFPLWSLFFQNFSLSLSIIFFLLNLLFFRFAKKFFTLFQNFPFFKKIRMTQKKCN